MGITVDAGGGARAVSVAHTVAGTADHPTFRPLLEAAIRAAASVAATDAELRWLPIRTLEAVLREARIDRAGCFAYSPVDGALANALPGALPDELREERRARFMAVAEAVSAAKLQSRVGQTLQVLVDSAPALGRKGGVGRSYADAPEIDGTVRLLPPEKISKTLKVGEFTRARIVATEGHDLIGQPI